MKEWSGELQMLNTLILGSGYTVVHTCKIQLAIHLRFMHFMYICYISTKKFYENIPFDLAIMFSS